MEREFRKSWSYRQERTVGLVRVGVGMRIQPGDGGKLGREVMIFADHLIGVDAIEKTGIAPAQPFPLI